MQNCRNKNGKENKDLVNWEKGFEASCEMFQREL